MKRFLALVLMVACAGQEEQIQQGVGNAPCIGDTCPPDQTPGSPSCPLSPVVRSVGTYWPKVVGYNEAHPPTQVIFASATNGFTCGGDSLTPPSTLVWPNSPRPWLYPISPQQAFLRRYPVCSECSGGWTPNQAFPTWSLRSGSTYAQSTAQACTKVCAGGDYCDSYQREDLAWQCVTGPGPSGNCHTW